MFAIGAIMKGMKNTGLRTIGAPNSIGSFTPNDVGTNEAFPIALFCLDLAININIKGTTNVAPVPPKVATKC